MAFPAFFFPVLVATTSGFLVVTLLSIAAQARLGRLLSRRFPEVWYDLPNDPDWRATGLPVRRFIYSSLGMFFGDPEVSALVARVRTCDRVAIVIWMVGLGSIVVAYGLAS